MTSVAPTAPDVPTAPAVDVLVRAEQVCQHRKTLPAALVGSALLGLIVAIVQSNATGVAPAAMWLAVLAPVLIGRAYLYHRHERGDPKQHQQTLWISRYRLLALLHGLVWALAAWWLFPAANLAYQSFLVFALAGICISSLTGYAFDLRTALAFCLPILSALMLRLLTLRSETGYMMAAIVLLFMAYVTAIAMRTNRTMREAVALRAAQASQLAAVRRSHEQQLRAESLAGLGSFEWTPANDSLQWSEGHYRLWGLEPEGRSSSLELFLQGVHPDDRERVESAFRRSVDTGEVEDSRYRVCWPDGQTRHVLGRSEIERDTQGRVVRLTGTVLDVTAHVRTEARLGEKRQLLSVMQQTTQLGFWFVDGGGRTTDVNPALCAMLACTRADLLGHSMMDRVDADYARRLRLLLSGAGVPAGETGSLVELVRLDSVGVRCLAHETALRDAGGKVAGLVVMVSDLSAMERARDAQHVSEFIVNSVHDMVSVTDLDGKYRFVNDAWCAGNGKSREQVLGRTVAEVAPFVVSAQRTEAGRQCIELREMRQLRVEVNLPRIGRRVMETMLTPYLTREAEMRGVVAVTRDVTEQERAAEALRANDGQQRALMDAFPGYVSVMDQDLVYTYVNARTAALFDATPESIVGRHVRDVLGEDSARRIAEEVDRINAGERVVIERRHDATQRHAAVYLQMTEVMGAKGHGGLQRYYSFGVDITELKNAESQLRAAKEAAEQADRAKSAFLASVSHELRTPLNAILGFSQLLRADPRASRTTSDNAGEIERAGLHLLALVDDLIDLGGVEAGHLELTLQRVAVETVINDSLSMVAPLAANQGIRIVFEGGDARHAVVLADAVRLRQVIINLLSNAIKYNRPDGSVRVSCRRHVPQGRSGEARIRIAVTDTGSGIAPELASRVFSAFERLGAERGAIEGTGIGLAISRRLVGAMGGSIGYESRLQSGSTFWIDLPPPTQPSLDALDSNAPGQPALLVQPLGHRHQPRLLVAEDYGPNQAVLRQQLTSLGCSVDMVSDGVEALQHWNASACDLVLSDLDMPRMGGHELASAIREQERREGGRRVPFIAISAAVLAGERERCLAAGMDDMLTKPVSLESLRAMLVRWLAGEPAGPEPAPGPTQQLPLLAVAAEPPTLPVLDLDALYLVLGRVSTRQAWVLIDTFIDSAAHGLRRFSDSPMDALALAREMHRQQSSARTVGAFRYAALAQSVERVAKTQPQPLPQLVQSLHSLEQALQQVREQARVLAQQEPTSMPAPLQEDTPAADLVDAVMVVDDDPVVLMQMQQMLTGIGIGEVLTARNGVDAMRQMAHRSRALEVVVCDLNMPEMDGVEMIRRFGQAGFSGALILMSGANEQLLATVSNLAQLQGLRVLGEIQKPATPQQMAGLLRKSLPRDALLRPAGGASPILPLAIQVAIRNGEFEIWFQPKVRVDGLVPVGVEALARWRQPDGSMVTPDLFIVAAERHGIIAQLSTVLLDTALREGARLHRAGFPLAISLNLSALWLDDLQLPDLLLQTAQEQGLRPSDINLEVTETGVTKDIAIALDVLTRLRLKGFGLSIDDFGIGYSSFEQIGRIPFTEMKLDRSFVNRGIRDSAARAILESSIAMATKLHLRTVAEGVETQEELALVRELGCDDVQGFLIARPMPCVALIDWLRARGAV